MIQTRLSNDKSIKYSYGPYNKFNDSEQWIRITEGCPNNCPYCYEPQEFKIFDTPEIVRNDVKIMDMNLLSKPESLKILEDLPEKVNGKVIYYELVCGIDYRFLTAEHASLLKSKRFKKIRLAWDWFYKDQYKIKTAVDILIKAGYIPREIMVFMICNWKIPFEENCLKLDLCKIWGVEVSDCWFDNQASPNIVPIHWNEKEIKAFRKKCRKHNQLVFNRFDPEVKTTTPKI